MRNLGKKRADANHYWSLEKLFNSFGCMYYSRSYSEVMNSLSVEEKELLDELASFKKLTQQGELALANEIYALADIKNEGLREAKRAIIKGKLIDSVKPIMASHIINVLAEFDSEANAIDLYGCCLEAADKAFSKYLDSSFDKKIKRVLDGKPIYAPFKAYYKLWLRDYTNKLMMSLRKKPNLFNLSASTELKLNTVLTAISKFEFETGKAPSMVDLERETKISKSTLEDFRMFTDNMDGEVLERRALESFNTISDEEQSVLRKRMRADLYKKIRRSLRDDEWFLVNHVIGLTTERRTMLDTRKLYAKEFNCAVYKADRVYKQALEKLARIPDLESALKEIISHQ